MNCLGVFSKSAKTGYAVGAPLPGKSGKPPGADGLKLRSALLCALAIFILALSLRLYEIKAVYYQFDEWLGGWHPNPALVWKGSFSELVRDFWANSREYVTSGQTIAWSALVEILQALCGCGVWKVRLLAALSGAVGAAVATLISWEVLGKNLAVLSSAGLMVAFSVSGIVFGQFADVYASAVFASALQLFFFVFFPRRRPGSRSAWTIFFAGAFVAQLLMYTQIWLTMALLMTACGFGKEKKSGVLKGCWLGLVVYGFLSGIHFALMLRIIPWSESFRWYMSSYYPAAADQVYRPLSSLLIYLPVRIYDFLSYHWSASFNPRIYQPLSFNVLSIPFFILMAVALGIRFFRRETTGDWVIQLGVWCIVVCLVANLFLLIPFGGIRQTVFLGPVAALLYAWAVLKILALFSGRSRSRRTVAAILCLLPVLPFAFSFPALYRDRISRVDLSAVARALDEFQPRGLVVSEQNIQILELELRDDPRFQEVSWPGYAHPSDALDADFRNDFPVLEFSYGGRRWRVHWITREYFPTASGRYLWLDMHISRGSRFEGEGMKRFYPDPAGSGRMPQPLSEVPGNSPKSLHQSLYWPPNSFYLYLIEIKPGSSPARSTESRRENG